MACEMLNSTVCFATSEMLTYWTKEDADELAELRLFTRLILIMMMVMCIVWSCHRIYSLRKQRKAKAEIDQDDKQVEIKIYYDDLDPEAQKAVDSSLSDLV